MSRIVFTNRFLETVKCKGAGAQEDHRDLGCPGLSIRVAQTGLKTWMFAYTSPRDQERTRIKLGTYPATKLITARELAVAARGQIERGVDPRDAAAETVAPKLISDLFKERMAKAERKGLRTLDEMRRRFKKYIEPKVGHVAVKDFKIAPHYNSVVDPILARGKTRTAGVIFQDLTALFNFAIERGELETLSPMVKVERPDEQVIRDVWLDADEIKTVWLNLGVALKKTAAVQDIVRLLLATGQRLSEVAGISRDEIDQATWVWTIPAARTKNGHVHKLPLSPLAVSIIKDLLRETNGAWLFPNRKDDGPLLHRVVDCALARADGKFGIEKMWRPHDLRRTVATHMSQLGVQHLHISHVLNHVSSTKSTITQSVYVKHDFMAEKKQALETWDSALAKLVGEEIEGREAA